MRSGGWITCTSVRTYKSRKLGGSAQWPNLQSPKSARCPLLVCPLSSTTQTLCDFHKSWTAPLSRSIFEGASKYEILHYLRDAKDRIGASSSCSGEIESSNNNNGDEDGEPVSRVQGPNSKEKNLAWDLAWKSIKWVIFLNYLFCYMCTG